MTHIPAMMEFGISDTPILIPRRFDEVDILTGTPEPDAFELDAPGFGTLNDLDRISAINGFFSQPGLQSLDDNFIAMGIDFKNNLIALSNPDTVDVITDSEEDILVYQEQERATYLGGFQAPTARSYTYIEDFEPINDSIVIGGETYQYEFDDAVFNLYPIEPSEFTIADDSAPICSLMPSGWCVFVNN